MLPTIGRIVLYKLSQYDVDDIDDHVPQRHDNGSYYRNPVREGSVYPAQVVATFGGTAANLVVQLDGPAQYWATSRNEGGQPGQWSWPPRA